MNSKAFILLTIFMLTACGGSDGNTANNTNDTNNGDGSGDDGTQIEKWWEPDVTDTWQWQLSGEINTGYDVDVYDIDLFETPDIVFETLHAQNRKIVCYFSAGSHEDWRDDANQFPAEVIGEPLDGWPGERWLDIRNDAVRDIMEARLDHAADRGCDGVEPDNIDGWSQVTGFDLSRADQLDYNRWLAAEAHSRGLAIALKNDVEQIPDLLEHFDFAVIEECFAYDECDALTPFVEAGKPVFVAEYEDKYVNDPAEREAICTRSQELGLHTLVLPLDLDDSFRFSCE